MSEKEEEIEGEHFMKVPMAHYNALREAADLGFEVLVSRRNALREVARGIPQYPARNSAEMAPRTNGLLDAIPVEARDVDDIVRRYDKQITCLAEALNRGLNHPRYK